jgi:hypothetical protein
MCESAGQGRCAGWLGAGELWITLEKGDHLSPGRYRRAWLLICLAHSHRLHSRNSNRSCFGIALNPICAQIFAVRNEE